MKWPQEQYYAHFLTKRRWHKIIEQRFKISTEFCQCWGGTRGVRKYYSVANLKRKNQTNLENNGYFRIFKLTDWQKIQFASKVIKLQRLNYEYQNMKISWKKENFIPTGNLDKKQSMIAWGTSFLCVTQSQTPISCQFWMTTTNLGSLRVGIVVLKYLMRIL